MLRNIREINLRPSPHRDIDSTGERAIPYASVLPVNVSLRPTSPILPFPLSHPTLSHSPIIATMNFSHQAFVSTPAMARSPWVGAAVTTRPPRATPSRVARRIAPATITMQTKDKKKPALTFATDIKGNVVWNLRAASVADTDAIANLVADKLPRSLVASFLETTCCSVVCEASAKGGKEDDVYQPHILGVSLVDVTVAVRDIQVGFEGGFLKNGELITIVTTPEMPTDDATSKLLLASMKLLKDDGVVDISHEVDHEDRIALLKESGFKEEGKTDSDLTRLVCDLQLANPDPKKKIL